MRTGVACVHRLRANAYRVGVCTGYAQGTVLDTEHTHKHHTHTHGREATKMTKRTGHGPHQKHSLRFESTV